MRTLGSVSYTHLLYYLAAVSELEANEEITSMLTRGWQAYDRTTTKQMQEMKKELALSLIHI